MAVEQRECVVAPVTVLKHIPLFIRRIPSRDRTLCNLQKKDHLSSLHPPLSLFLSLSLSLSLGSRFFLSSLF